MQRMSRAQRLLTLCILLALEVERKRRLRRPPRRFGGGSVTAVTDHGKLTGLLDDDHTQYVPVDGVARQLADAGYPNALLLDGSRAMTGTLDMDGNVIGNFLYMTQKYGTSGYIQSQLYGFPTFFQAKPTAGNTNVAVLGNYQIGGAGDWYPQFGLHYGRLLGDLDVASDSVGPLLIDRTTATKYRLYVDNGVLGIEEV
jgi:hypothetical protein